MSIGNLKTDGGKGTNWPWQYKMLLGLDKIASAIVTGGKDYESDLVSITCAGPVPPAGTVLRLEVRVFDTTTGSFTSVSYYEPGSITPDPADYSGCTKTYLEAGDATEATLELCRQLLATIDTDTGNIATSTATTATNTTNIETNTDSLVDTSNAPTILRATANALVTLSTQVIKSISFYNATTDATNNANVNGVILRQGETVNFDAGSNGNTFPTSSFNYNADPSGVGAGDLLIIYVE